MAYSREDIDRVRDSTDLVELAAEVTKIRRTARSVMAVCPFHQEKTPSLSIDPARGLFHCFGCGKSGDVFRWVEETQGLNFSEAVEMLARRSGITLTVDPGAAKRRSEREDMVKVTEAAVEFYLSRLREADDAGKARSYLRSRGYGAEIVDRFKIGYSPAGWDELSTHLKKDGFNENVLVGAGLSSRSRTGRLVDRFRGRVMFPIYDLRGDAVGFGARLLEGEGPKYLNSPETPIYHKSSLLYGLNWAKSDIVRTGRAIVVEGYTDVIAFHLAGDPVAVATCGTALGEAHFDLLRRFTERIVLTFDADEAGAGAALRGQEFMQMAGGLDLRVAEIPEGADPAGLVSDGLTEVLLKAVDASIPLLQFRIDRELGKFDLSEAEARGRAVRACADLIALHPDSVIRHEYSVLVARRTGVDLDVIESAVATAVRTHRPAQLTNRRPEPAEHLSGTDRAERELLRLVLANDPSIRDIAITAELFETPEHRAVFEHISEAIYSLAPGVAPDLGSLIGNDEDESGKLARELALVDRPTERASDLFNRLKVAVLERRIQEVRRNLELLDPEDDQQMYSKAFSDLINLERERREIRGTIE